MLYLSRLLLDTHSREVRRGLADCYALHRDILSAFPSVPSGVQVREHAGVLYRVEPYEHNSRLVRLLVQSAVAPEWSQLPVGYVGPAPDNGRGNPAVRRVDPEYEHIQSGMPLVFRLRANPTRRISAKNASQDARWHGKRVELRREDDQLAWLSRKGEQGGFRLIGVQVRPDVPDTLVTTLDKVRGKRPVRQDEKAMSLRFGAVLFEGHLEVTNREMFLKTLQSGIGSGKAFGFGLLSVASVR